MRLFPESDGEEAGERPSVCIVTSELIGPFNNGGIGTSMTGLACCLAEAGFPVTILYTGGKFTSPAELDRWRALYAGIGIAVDWIRHEEAGRLSGPVAGCGFSAPWLVWLWLRERRFDIVQFNDCMGEGFYCLAMKRLGAAFGSTAMFAALHSPSQWIFEINRTPPDTLLFAAFNFAERLSVRTADLLWAPSLYLLDWIKGRGFEPPATTFLQKYIMPPVPLFDPAEEPSAPAAREPVFPSEIAFFGRLEERKGLRLFCRALRLVEPLLFERGIAVTFLGKAGSVAGRPAEDYLAEEAKDWRFDWTMRTGLGQQEALAHLGSGRAVAVMASPADNSPCTIYEALACSIPFLAARTGGMPELIAEGDKEEMLFDHEPDALAAKLRSAVEKGLRPARPAEEREKVRRRWIGGFRQALALVPAPPAREPERRLIVLIDGEDCADLAATLASLDAPEVEAVLLVCRRWSGGASACSRPIVPIPPDEPLRLADAIGAGGATTILMLRAGCILAPGAAGRLVEALRAPGVDGLVPAATIEAADGQRTIPPLGGHPSFAFFEGPAPGGALAVKADRLAPLIAARPLAADSEFLGLADLAIASGLAIWPFAEALVSHPDMVLEDRRNRRAPERIAAYSALAGETERLYIAAIGLGGFAPHAGVAARLRGLREWMMTHRLGWAARKAAAIMPRRMLDRLRRRGRQA
jgi:glycosyltransferase involved in cell wall biosynthesis